jgi:hypothetical protein
MHREVTITMIPAYAGTKERREPAHTYLTRACETASGPHLFCGLMSVFVGSPPTSTVGRGFLFFLVP